MGRVQYVLQFLIQMAYLDGGSVVLATHQRARAVVGNLEPQLQFWLGREPSAFLANDSSSEVEC